MKNLWLIIQREYLTRVKKKSFILLTILTPFIIGLFIALVAYIFGNDWDEEQNIAIIDKAEIFDGKIRDESRIYFTFEKRDLEDLRNNFAETGYNGIVVIDPIRNVEKKDFEFYYYSEEQLGLDIKSSIERKIRNQIRDYKMVQLGLDQSELDKLSTSVTIDPEPIDEAKREEDESSMGAEIAGGIGIFFGFAMYFAVFFYGMMVMRGVMEEKMNRIVEVMISSVKPFELMMGKIIGIGAVGLTQLVIWMIMVPLISTAVQLIMGIDSNTQMEMASNMGQEVDIEESQAMMFQIIEEIKNQNWGLMLPLFIIYFLGGYFLYASLFAAVGSAMGDDMAEGQALTIPITIPIILAFYISFVAIRSPNSSLAVWSSIFPLFSPLVMPARLGFDIPLWQIIVSVLVLIASVVFFVWLSGRIYRVGILLYGKKVTFKELGKWLFYKG